MSDPPRDPYYPQSLPMAASPARYIPGNQDAYSSPTPNSPRTAPGNFLRDPAEPRAQRQIQSYEDNPQRNPDDEEFPTRTRRVSLIPLGTTEERRDSDATVIGFEKKDGKPDPNQKYSMSSYEHPYDIPPPPSAHPGQTQTTPQARGTRSAVRRSVSFAKAPGVREYDPDDEIDKRVKQDEEDQLDEDADRDLKRRGIPSNMLDLYALDRSLDAEKNGMDPENSSTSPEQHTYPTSRPRMRRGYSATSNASMGSDVYDPDDPRVTGIKAEFLDDPEDVEKNLLRQMNYKQRRKHLMRVKIEFNVSCKTSARHKWN